MKKYLFLFGAAILVMAFASPSMAQFKSWGHIEIQTIWEVKPDFNTGQTWQFDSTRDPGRNMTWRHIAQRYRFYLQYGDAKTVRAVLGFEADSEDWGEAAAGGTAGNNTTVPPVAASNSGYQSGSQHFGVYRADQVQLEIKHAYIDFTVPNTPISVSAGLQFFDVAGRMWMNNDAPGVIVTANFAPHRLRGLWWRENDNNRFTYGVNDTYVLAWDMTRQLWNAGLWGAYKNDLFTGQIGTYSYPAVVTGATNLNWATSTQTTPGAVEQQQFVMQLTTPVNKFDDHPWYIGASGGFRPGNFDLSGQFIYNAGKRKFTQINTPGAPTGDSTYNAFAFELAGKYRIGPGLFVGVEGYYATGQDYNKNDKITQYTVPTVSEGQSIFGNDRTVFMWMNAAQMGYYHERNFTITGFWYARANVEYSPLTWLRLNLNYLYIGDTNSGNPFTAGSPGFSPLTRLPLTSATKLVNTPLGARQDVDKQYVGSELNLITTLRIYQNFDYNIGVYAFFPSDMFDRVTLNAAGATTNTVGAATSYGINTKLIYAF